jgi:hypothetical protein
MKAFSIALTVALFSTGKVPASAGALLQVNGHVLKWDSRSPGGKTVVTYAVLTGSYALPGGRRILSPDNCSSMHAFADIVRLSPGIAAEAAERELRAAFATWSAAAGIAFIEVRDPLQANIVVGAQDFPVGRAFTNLSYLSGHGILPVEKALGGPGPSAQAGEADASGAIGGIEQSYVCLNPGMRWKTSRTRSVMPSASTIPVAPARSWLTVMTSMSGSCRPPISRRCKGFTGHRRN